MCFSTTGQIKRVKYVFSYREHRIPERAGKQLNKRETKKVYNWIQEVNLFINDNFIIRNLPFESVLRN